MERLASRGPATGAGARLAAATATGSGLRAFLDEPSTEKALHLWFGAELMESLANDRGRLLSMLDVDIARIDERLSAQLALILESVELQRLEATWRGTRYLAGLLEKGERVKLRILNISWAEVARDLERASDFDQSMLFELVYSQEFGIAGGEPFGLLIGDYHLTHRVADRDTDDVGTLRLLAGVAAAAFAPFVCGCDPGFFGLDRFAELGAELDLHDMFRQIEYQRWRSLRDLDDARFLGLCLPDVMLRLPWTDAPRLNTPFRFENPRQQGLWGTAAFAFGAIALQAFIQTGWFAEIRGVRRGQTGGGLVPGLPEPHFTTDTAPLAFKHPVAVAVSDRQERSLAELGFIPLSVTEYFPGAIFYGNQSIRRPERYREVAATANEQLSSMLQYMLCVARFAHAIKVIARERVASFTSAVECQTLLQTWLAQYVTSNPNASLDLRTKFPLREGRVAVSDDPARPGSYRLDIHLRPHLQLDDISTGIRLTSELAGPRVN